MTASKTSTLPELANLIYDEHSSGVSLYKIDAAEPSTGNVIVNNTIIIASDGRWAVNIQDASTGNLVYNNITAQRKPFARQHRHTSADSLSGFSSDYNAVMDRFTPDDNNFETLAQWRAGTGQDPHSFVATEAQLFTSASTSDFTLSPTSPAIDAGAVAAAPNQPPVNDLLGNARPQGAGYDLGAYEFVQSGTPTNPPPTVTPPLTAKQKVAADKARLAADLLARIAARAADRKAIVAARGTDQLALARDRRAMAADHEDAANLTSDEEQLGADALKLKTDVAHLSAVLAADALHWSQVLRSDRMTLGKDLKLLHK